jgi:hypothetical protein
VAVHTARTSNTSQLKNGSKMVSCDSSQLMAPLTHHAFSTTTSFTMAWATIVPHMHLMHHSWWKPILCLIVFATSLHSCFHRTFLGDLPSFDCHWQPLVSLYGLPSSKGKGVDWISLEFSSKVSMSPMLHICTSVHILWASDLPPFQAWKAVQYHRDILQTLKTNSPKSIITLGSICHVFSPFPRKSVY